MSCSRASRYASAILICAAMLVGGRWSSFAAAITAREPSLLREHLLVTFYGNPHSAAMGVLGQQSGARRASALRAQAQAYVTLTNKRVLPAYHLVAVVAQPRAGADGKWRRRESCDVIVELLAEARANGFHLVLDVQPGRADLVDEMNYLRNFLAEPDVHLALDPEFDMDDGQVPGNVLGHTDAVDVNRAVSFLSALVSDHGLPPKVLIVHQFTLGMLPDKRQIVRAPNIDLVLNMDGFGSQSLKLSTYGAIIRQHPLDFAGIKLFYTIDTGLFSPHQILRLTPAPSVVIYQ